MGDIKGHCGGVVRVLEFCRAGAIGYYSGVLQWGGQGAIMGLCNGVVRVLWCCRVEQSTISGYCGRVDTIVGQ